MARAKSIFAQFRQLEAGYRQAKRVIVALAAALEEQDPTNPALAEYRLFIQGADTPTDDKPESR